MSRNYNKKHKPWSKLKSRVEALWAPGLPLAIHCNVFRFSTKFDTFDEPRHWVVLDKRIIWDFPVPFMRPDPPRGKYLEYFETGYGWAKCPKPSVPSSVTRAYVDRPREALWEPLDDPFELADILRAADRRLGKAALLAWAADLDAAHPARPVLARRFGL